MIFHPDYLKYDLGSGHPFSPVRVQMMLELLYAYGIKPELSEPERILPEQLLTVHQAEYVDFVEQASQGKMAEQSNRFGLGTADNPIRPGMAEAARILAGGTLLGADLLLNNKATKVLQLGGGFHHARPAQASGFCLYNDLALSIRKMTEQGWHVAYLDIDVHHGDGVQDIFYSDERVMTISLHESGEYIFPGTGWLHELGRGMGRSLKLNVPLEPFTQGDSYFKVLEDVAEPALSWFKPDVLVVQAGADAHFSDPLADLMLTSHDYERIFRRILNLTDHTCNGRVLFTLGGGYALTATARIWTILYLVFMGLDIPEKLPSAWHKRWSEAIGHPLPKTLHDAAPFFNPIPRKAEIEQQNAELVQRLMDAVAADWI